MSETAGSTLTLEDRFAIIPEWVLDHPLLSDRAVRLYLVLRTFADNATGVAWPSRARLAKRLRCSADSVDRAVTQLVKVGALTVRPRHDEDHGQRSNAYVVRNTRPGSTSTPLRTGAEGGGQQRPGPSASVPGAQPHRCGPELEPGELEGGSHRARAGDTPSPAPKIDPTHGGKHRPGNPGDIACHQCRDEKVQAAAAAAELKSQREREAIEAARAARAAELAATTPPPPASRIREIAAAERAARAAHRSVPLSGTSDG